VRRIKLDDYLKAYDINSVCDMGCGKGGLLKKVNECYGKQGLSLTGIDYFSRLGECCRPKTEDSNLINFIEKDSEVYMKLVEEGSLNLEVKNTTAYLSNTTISIYDRIGTNLVENVEKSILDYVGVLGMAKSGLEWIKKGKNEAIIAVNRQALNNVRASFALFKGHIHAVKVSGTLKKIKGK